MVYTCGMSLEKLLTKSGKITIAALDHRGSLQKTLNPVKPEMVGKEEIMEWKRGMVGRYKQMVSGILIDPIYGKELVDPGASCGWMLSMEQTGYRGGKEARVTELLPNWSVKQAKELGASGVKLLLYYDPENRELARQQKELARRVGEECEREEVIFLLEPLSYVVRGTRGAEVVKIAEELQDLAVDIWKFEDPESREACEEIGRIVKKPWVLLSAGMKYEQYKEALRIACEAGASGMAVGRAVWQEFGEYEGEERERFLGKTAVIRMRELVEIVEKYGKSVQS